MSGEMRVLIVETAPRYRDELSSLLRTAGFDARPVESREARETLESERFDLVVVGLRQTHVDPMLLVQRAVELGIPCLVTAAGFYDREAREVCRLGADSVWMYPLDVDRFLERARAVLHSTTAVPSILLIEDNRDTRHAFRRTLEQGGFSVVEADRGIEGVRLAMTRAVDAVVLDINLPGLDGLSVCQILKGDASTAKIPILVATVRVGPEDEVRIAAAGADAFLAKPFRPDLLVDAVRKLVEQSRLREEARKG